MSGLGNKNDGVTLILSLVALFLAGVLSINTFSNQVTDTSMANSSDPFDKAQAAAQAGMDIVKWEIECNGRTERGSLPPRYWVNGATYAVEWDDVNLTDSTVNVRSKGVALASGDLSYQALREAKLKLAFFPQQQNEILKDYYSKNREPLINQQPR